MTDYEDASSGGSGDVLTRRGFLKVGAGAAAVSGAAGLLAACGGKDSSAQTQTAAAGTPKRGGTLTLGVISGGTAETVVPALGINAPDLVRLPQLYEPLFRVGPEIKDLIPTLALSAEPNADATSWTLQLRPDVVWHDGKPFTADDVVWTIQQWQNPRNLNSGQTAGMIDYERLRKRGNLTIEVPLLFPVAQFPTLMTSAAYNNLVVPNGTSISEQAHNPVGTGPFKFVSFQPGSQSVFAANPHYWQPGLPYLDKLIVDSSFTAPAAQMNALLAGDIHVSTIAPYTLAKENESNSQIEILNSIGGNWYQICMRINRDPWTDVRVRQAMRLIANRPEIIAAGLDGYGTVGNDLLGKGCTYFASDLTRSQDIEQAKSLLKAAGKSGLTATLPVADAAPGLLESATVYAQQAKAAGVNVILQNVSSSTYFTPSGGYLSRPFGLDYNAYSDPSLTVSYRGQYNKNAPYNDTAWGLTPATASTAPLLAQAVGELNPSKAAELWHEVQLLQFNEGGALVFAYAAFVDIIATNVHGLQTTMAGYLNNWHLLGAWLS